MKKQIANILTSVRMVISSILLTFSRLDGAFLALFCVCGITDLIDGPIARATGTESILGAKLDSAGDVLTYAAMVRILILEKAITLTTVLWFVLPLSGMVVSALIAKLRFHSFFFIHTLLSKLFGVSCFWVPFCFAAGAVNTHLTFVWVIALLADVEMVVIQLMNDRAESDVPFLYTMIRRMKQISTSENNRGVSS